MGWRPHPWRAPASALSAGQPLTQGQEAGRCDTAASPELRPSVLPWLQVAASCQKNISAVFLAVNTLNGLSCSALLRESGRGLAGSTEKGAARVQCFGVPSPSPPDASGLASQGCTVSGV